MTNVFIVPLLALLLALFALGVVAALVNLRDFIPRRFRCPIYAGVVVLLMATAALVSRSGGPASLAGVWVASLALVVFTNSNSGVRKPKKASGTRDVIQANGPRQSLEVASCPPVVGRTRLRNMSLKMTIILGVIALLVVAIAIQFIYNPHPELNFFPGFDPRK